MILSERLKSVTDLLPQGNTVADIGCDHGYISISLVESGRFNRAIAMDVRKGPLSIANENITKHGFSGKIETRLSDGFDNLSVGEVDGAILAGMGGLLVIGILERNLEKVKKINHIVLQPQSDINLVRKYLREHGFTILKENMVKDEGKYYPMFLVSALEIGDFPKSEDDWLKNHHLYGNLDKNVLQDTFDYYGQMLIRDKNDVLNEYVCHEKEVFESVLAKLPEDNIKRKNEVEYRITLANTCLTLIRDNS